MHGYIIMLLLMFIEGASVTYVAAFISSTGVFNIYMVILISILGFTIEDMVLYFIGKYYGKKILVKHIYNGSRGKIIKKLISGINKNPGKTITIVKITPVIPVPGIIMIGASDVSLKKFLMYSIPITMIYSLVFAGLGFFSGVTFGAISKDLAKSDYIIAIAVLLVILVWLIIKSISTRLDNKIERYVK
jgi:membrane-associated protein